jgi:hypothetical protein
MQLNVFVTEDGSVDCAGPYPFHSKLPNRSFAAKSAGLGLALS